MVWCENRHRESDILDSRHCLCCCPSTWQGMVEVARELMPELAHMKNVGQDHIASAIAHEAESSCHDHSRCTGPCKGVGETEGFC